MKYLMYLLLAAMMGGCASVQMEVNQEEPVTLKPRENLITVLPDLDGPPITVAVYGFKDLTGQKKPNDKLALFSSAVTQGSEVFLIKSLQDSKNWFKVVERVGLDNLVKERQLIRNQREVYEGKEARPLKPLVVAGVMIEGGIIGYDSNIRSGGNGARFLGIGGSQQYRVDEIVISMRLVSINSGEVLITTAVSKTIYSTQHNIGVLRFVDQGTKSLELENGAALNEPTTYAVRVAIEQAVYEMIMAGEKKGLWRFKDAKSSQAPAPVKKVEEKKDELVQQNTAPKDGKETTSSTDKPNISKDTSANGGEKLTDKTNPQVPTQKSGEVIEWSNVRSTRSKDSDKVANVKPGTVIKILESNDGYYRVRVDDKEGWVAQRFVKIHR